MLNSNARPLRANFALQSALLSARLVSFVVCAASSDDHEGDRTTEANGGIPPERYAFVCMVGQTQRAKLDDKIRYLFRPLQRATSQMEIGLVLETKRSPVFSGFGYRCNASFFQSPIDLQHKLSRNGINGTLARHIYKAPEAVQNSTIFRTMTKRLINHGAGINVAYGRMLMFLSQWEKLWTCSDLMEHVEQVRGLAFTHVLRIREDHVLPYQADVETLLRKVEVSPQQSTLTSACEGMILFCLRLSILSTFDTFREFLCHWLRSVWRYE